MKFVNIIVAALLVSTSFLSCQSEIKKDDLKNQKLKQSYSLGVYYGKNMKSQLVEMSDVDKDAFLQGIKDGVTKDSTYLLTETEIRAVFDSLGNQLKTRQMAKIKVESEKNKKEEEAFFAKNKTAEGVKTTGSGLQYLVLASGNGPTPKPTDQVKANYIGRLLSGKEFDNSYKRGEPAVFPVTGVIPGWTEALQLMKVGDKWRLFIPSHLGYGEQGAGQGQIPPNSALIFDVELLSIEQPAKDGSGK